MEPLERIQESVKKANSRGVPTKDKHLVGLTAADIIAVCGQAKGDALAEHLARSSAGLPPETVVHVQVCDIEQVLQQLLPQHAQVSHSPPRPEI